MAARSKQVEFFQALYQRDPDPWRFASSPYERDKYAATLAAIGETPIERAWEVGCSIGVFTRALAARCSSLLAVDLADAALEQARGRCADRPWVTFRRMAIPRQWPREQLEGKFDLIVFSEVLYFLSAADVRLTARKALRTLAEGGRIVLVNWTGETGQSLSGEAAADVFHQAVAADVASICRQRRPGFRLQVYQRTA